MKKLNKLEFKQSELLYLIVDDIIKLNLDGYDIESIKGENNKFRIRKGKIRIIFLKSENIGIIKNIDFRGGIYK